VNDDIRAGKGDLLDAVRTKWSHKSKKRSIIRRTAREH
jgi:hypothetical protein